jgi:hypothetical protein
MNTSDNNTLAVWEGKIQRKIFGPLNENGLRMIRTNQELMDVSGEPDMISEVRRGRSQWLGDTERMPEGKKL